MFYFFSIGVLQSIGIDLKCVFVTYTFDGYNCKAENLKIENQDTAVTDIKGSHLASKSNSNVAVLYIPSSNCIKSIPSGISRFFPNLKKLEATDGSLKYLSQKSFAGLNSLQTIDIRGNLLSKIPDDTFDNLPKLEILILNENRIQKIELNTFEKLLSLKKVLLSENLLETLPKELFEKNMELEEIYLSNNRLRHIDADFTSELKHLKNLALDGNFCISKVYPEDMSLDKLKAEISSKCTNGTEFVYSSELTKMSHDLLISQQGVNASIEKIIKLEESLMKRSLDVDALESDKRELINELGYMQLNLTASNEKNQDLELRLENEFETIRKLKESFDLLQDNCSKIEERYENMMQVKIDEEILRHNKTVISLKAAESSKDFIKTAFVSSSFVLIMLLIIAFVINISLIKGRANVTADLPRTYRSFDTELKPKERDDKDESHNAN